MKNPFHIVPLLMLLTLAACGGDDDERSPLFPPPAPPAGDVGENLPPQATAGPDRTVPLDTAVVLDGRGSVDPEGEPLAFTWTVEERPEESLGELLTEENAATPTFSPDVPGFYTVRLTVSDGVHESTDVVRILVDGPGNDAPFADAGADRSVPVGTLVLLDGSGSTDPENDPLDFSWFVLERPLGSTVNLTAPNSPTPTFFTDRDGIYVLELTVIDPEGLFDSDTVTIVSGEPVASPEALAGPDRTVPVGTVVILDGSESFDPEGGQLSFSWITLERPQGSLVNLTATNSPTPTFVPDRQGFYRFRLAVVNEEGLRGEDEVLIGAGDPTLLPPLARPGEDRTVAAGEPVTLDGSGSFDPAGSPLAYTWELVEDPPGSLARLEDFDTVAPSFFPDVVGRYILRLTVRSASGLTDSETLVLTAIPPSSL